MRRAILILSAAAFALVSCVRPGAYEEFLTVGESVAGRYNFELDMSDSLDTYDVSFYTRVDRGRTSTVREYPPLKLDIWWKSPSGKVFDETVYMSSGDYRGVRELYRSGIVPSERGVWTLCIQPENPPKGLRGMGVICERYGAR